MVQRGPWWWEGLLMLKEGPHAQRGPDIQRGPWCSEPKGALFFWWAGFLDRPRWSEGPRLSGRVFCGFPHRFRDFCVGFGYLRRSFGSAARSGPKTPRERPFRPPPCVRPCCDVFTYTSFTLFVCIVSDSTLTEAISNHLSVSSVQADSTLTQVTISRRGSRGWALGRAPTPGTEMHYWRYTTQ